LKTILSTISERTERTDPSTPYRSRQHRLLTTSSRSFVSSPTTSYGNELGNASSTSPSILYLPWHQMTECRATGRIHIMIPIQADTHPLTLP
jgi:hypothetical protein